MSLPRLSSANQAESAQRQDLPRDHPDPVRQDRSLLIHVLQSFRQLPGRFIHLDRRRRGCQLPHGNEHLRFALAVPLQRRRVHHARRSAGDHPYRLRA